VGLGNLWRFPYIAGENGGGAFVIIYLACVFLIGAPIIAAELAIGREGGGSAITTMKRLIAEREAAPFWRLIGWLSLLVPFLGLTYYSVVAGWAMDYIVAAARNTFAGFDAAQSNQAFERLMAAPGRTLFWQALFIALTVWVVARGVRGGIEKATRVLMPALFLLLVVLVGYAILGASFREGLVFLFNPDFSKVTASVVLIALGQAFFSLAVGVGVMITYGAYLPGDSSLARHAVVIAGADTLVAILAGLAIFPVVFASGLAPGEGPGLIFATLPIAFGNMPGGHIFGFLFFVLIFFAAFTSSIGMVEPIVSWLEEHKGFTRPAMSAATGIGALAIGVGATLSFNLWAESYPLGFLPLFESKTVFGILDFTVANFMLPLNGLLIVLFAGWVMSHARIAEALGVGDGFFYRYWHLSIRYLVPVAVAAVLVTSLS
jgi:NSS family neurotransmitter:Na+ symporter